MRFKNGVAEVKYERSVGKFVSGIHAARPSLTAEVSAPEHKRVRSTPFTPDNQTAALWNSSRNALATNSHTEGPSSSVLDEIH